MYVDAPMTKGVDGAVEGVFTSPRPKLSAAARRASKKGMSLDVGARVEEERGSEGTDENRREERRESEYERQAPESGPFIKSGGFFGECHASLYVLCDVVFEIDYKPCFQDGRRSSRCFRLPMPVLHGMKI